MMIETDRPDWQFCACVWCGQWISKDAFRKRTVRKLGQADTCKDCRDTRKEFSIANTRQQKNWKHPQLGHITCYIWLDELNDDWLPVDDEGNLFMPGQRICGLKDCVNSKHVVAPKQLTVSDIDLILSSMEVRAKHKTKRTK